MDKEKIITEISYNIHVKNSYLSKIRAHSHLGGKPEIGKVESQWLRSAEKAALQLLVKFVNLIGVCS